MPPKRRARRLRRSRGSRRGVLRDAGGAGLGGDVLGEKQIAGQQGGHERCSGIALGRFAVNRMAKVGPTKT